ncbi:MAG: carbohydrate-binding protein [Chitinophagaceae bacterium]|nr:MAG: carbohydrate-binding protein [Chitinophagaceae bacterium]
MLIAGFSTISQLNAQLTHKPTAEQLAPLQQKFIDYRFGMFLHFNIPTFMDHDWADPEAPASTFAPTGVDVDQWAKAAKSANMSYGCLTTKHHSGFCIWDTKTTDYNVMNSPYKKDIVAQYVKAFRDNGLGVMLYYSILDTHHKLRPHQIKPKHIEMVKNQITELLTNYGKIEALIIDGWDAPWSRISYDDIPFEEIYMLIKKLQPDCLVMDLNGAKYPGQGMYYTDIKTYEMGAGQRLAKESQVMPSLACLPINGSWFWKTDFPSKPVKDPAKLISETIDPLNEASCNFILNVSPNRDGRIDDNAIAALAEIGKQWKNEGPLKKLPILDAPVTSTNIALNKPSNSSWSDDMDIMDFANDDDYKTSWVSNKTVKQPWFEVDLGAIKTFNTIVIAEKNENITGYTVEYFENGKWKELFKGDNARKFKFHRFKAVKGNKVRLKLNNFSGQPAITEFQVYNEIR